jgi:hypothetical protein
MAQFTITGPDKRSVTITAPDDATPELIQQKLDSIKSQWGKEGALSWSDVPGQALRNAPGSAVNLAKNIAQPILHPIDTAKNLGNLAYGVGSKIGGALGVEQDPQRKADNEASADAVGRFFADRYGSSEGIKKTLATDPVGALADAATVLTGGGALVARAPGVAGQVGRVAGRVGSTIDPIAGGVRLAGGTASKVGEAAASIAGMTTGAGKMPLEYAYKAGKQGNATFIDHMRGNAPLTDVGDMAKSAVGDMARERSASYTAGMQNVKGSGLINFQPIKYAVNDAFDMVHFKGVPKSKEAADVVKNISALVDQWEQIPTSQYRSAEGLDALKQAIREVRQRTQYGTLERKVADQVYNRVKGQIVKQAPEYANVMKDYSNASDQISDISKTFSLGEKASKDTALRKLTSVMRNNVNTNFGQRAKLMDEMAAKQPDLPYAIAGQALNSPTPRGLNQVVASGTLGYGAAINPTALAALPFASPRLMGEAAYGAGALSGQFENALLKLGVTPGQFVNALRALNQTGGNALSGGIGPRYDENGNPR